MDNKNLAYIIWVIGLFIFVVIGQLFVLGLVFLFSLLNIGYGDWYVAMGYILSPIAMITTIVVYVKLDKYI